jgi:ABC-type dipeptide/oligopeptide/nickel transport system permease component
MLGFIARRVALALPALFGLVVLTFILSRYSGRPSGDPGR